MTMIDFIYVNRWNIIGMMIISTLFSLMLLRVLFGFEGRLMELLTTRA